MTRWTAALLCVLSLAPIACGSTEPTTQIQGTYALSAVNGTALPAVVASQGATVTVCAGVLDVAPTTFALTLDFLAPPAATCGAGTDREQVTGAWSRTGAATFAFDDSTSMSGSATVVGQQLTIQFGDATFVFVRR